MGVIGKIVYRFSQEDLREEVYQRTSLIGKNKGVDGIPYLEEELSLSTDESWAFERYIRNSALYVYDQLGNFTHHVSQPIIITSDDVGGYYSIRSYESLELYNTNLIRSIYSSECEGDRLYVSYNGEGVSEQGLSIETNIKIRYVYSDFLGIQKEKEEEYKQMLTSGSSCTFMLKLGIDIHSSGGGLQNESFLVLKDVIVTSVVVDSSSLMELSVGDIVLITDSEGAKKKCRVKTSGNVIDLMQRENSFEVIGDGTSQEIVFTLNLFDWWNRGYESSVKDSIRESIVCGIMSEWFSEIQQLELSSLYMSRRDVAIVDMKNRLNAQKKPIRRNYTYY